MTLNENLVESANLNNFHSLSKKCVSKKPWSFLASSNLFNGIQDSKELKRVSRELFTMFKDVEVTIKKLQVNN